MRTSKALELLAAQERRFQEERRLWADERARLLDRIMVLAEKPMFEMAEPTPFEPETDIVDADEQMFLDEVFPLRQ